MITVGCAPGATALPTPVDIPFRLYGRPPGPGVGGVGANIPDTIHALGLSPPARAWDFLSIALSIVAADEACTRGQSPDGWTRQIGLTIAVVDWSFWRSVAVDLEEALNFVTGDIWNIIFIDGGFLPHPLKAPRKRAEDVVSLLSGGMDSLIGAIDLVANGRLPLLVSQVAKGDKEDQTKFAKIISPKTLHIQANHNARPPCPSERSQRGRSMAFFGLGVLAATCLKKYDTGPVDLIVPENGFISLNVPLTPLRIGSLSTRTTHPFYLTKLQKIFDAAGLKVKLVNPYQMKTKGEMLAECQNQPLLKQLIGDTTSCGRYARMGFRQCGRCVPCLVRRASFVRWGNPDTTPQYKFDALGRPGHQYRDFDDVKSAAYAALLMRSKGADAWIGGSINSAVVSNPLLLRQVAERGLRELDVFLTAQGIL